MTAKRRPPRTRNSARFGRSVGADRRLVRSRARQRRDAVGKGVSSWIFFAESAPLLGSLGTRRRRARPARAALRVVRPGDATAGRTSPREGVLARRLPIPPRPENFPKTRHLLASSSWPCPRARVRPACPRRSALRSSPTSVRLRSEAVSSNPVRARAPELPLHHGVQLVVQHPPVRGGRGGRPGFHPRQVRGAQTRRVPGRAPRPARRLSPRTRSARVHPANDSTPAPRLGTGVRGGQRRGERRGVPSVRAAFVRILRRGVRRQSERVGVAAGRVHPREQLPTGRGERRTQQVRRSNLKQ